MDAKGAKDVLSSGIQTSQVNVAIQDANIAAVSYTHLDVYKRQGS